MGSLITETPFSEVAATLELLDHFGVGREDLKNFRAAVPEVQAHIARILKTVDSVTAISTRNTVSEPTRSWREQDGVIYFSVTSDGTTGEDWIKRLKSNGFRVGVNAKQILRSPDFKPTSGVTTEVAVLKGILFENQSRFTKKICTEADDRNLSEPNAELACLIREMFTDKEIEAMGLDWIVVMHKSISGSGSGPSLLEVGRDGVGRWLSACDYRGPGGRWGRYGGFAFAV
jgi:hypothetical protein